MAAVAAEQFVATRADEGHLVVARYPLSDEPRWNGGFVGVGFVQCLHDGLENISNIRFYIHDGELNPVSVREGAGECCFIGGLGTPARISHCVGMGSPIVKRHRGHD